MGIKNVKAESFVAEVLDNDRPVLVDFWAEWCGPCRQMNPSLVSIAEELEGKVDVVKVNIDEEPSLANEYAISSIPAIFLFRNGEVVDISIGAKPKNALLGHFSPYLQPELQK